MEDVIASYSKRGRILAVDEATKVLLQTRAQSHEKLQSVFTPYFESIIEQLFDMPDSIVLSGNIFLVHYHLKDDDMIFIKPETRLVPCGWLSVKGMQRALKYDLAY
jgi:hypothetical protein